MAALCQTGMSLHDDPLPSLPSRRAGSRAFLPGMRCAAAACRWGRDAGAGTFRSSVAAHRRYCLAGRGPLGSAVFYSGRGVALVSGDSAGSRSGGCGVRRGMDAAPLPTAQPARALVDAAAGRTHRTGGGAICRAHWLRRAGGLAAG